jgi:hypothetical protein
MRFNDVGYSWSFIHLVFEKVQLLREDEGFGEKIEVGDAVPNLHPGDVFVHEVLTREMEGIGKVIDLLVGEEGLISFVLDNSRRPIKRPVFISVRMLEAVFIEQSLN